MLYYLPLVIKQNADGTFDDIYLKSFKGAILRYFNSNHAEQTIVAPLFLPTKDEIPHRIQDSNTVMELYSNLDIKLILEILKEAEGDRFPYPVIHVYDEVAHYKFSLDISSYVDIAKRSLNTHFLQYNSELKKLNSFTENYKRHFGHNLNLALNNSPIFLSYVAASIAIESLLNAGPSLGGLKKYISMHENDSIFGGKIGFSDSGTIYFTGIGYNSLFQQS